MKNKWNKEDFLFTSIWPNELQLQHWILVGRLERYVNSCQPKTSIWSFLICCANSKSETWKYYLIGIEKKSYPIWILLLIQQLFFDQFKKLLIEVFIFLSTGERDVKAFWTEISGRQFTPKISPWATIIFIFLKLLIRNKLMDEMINLIGFI